jgi:hypothetical protein
MYLCNELPEESVVAKNATTAIGFLKHINT